MSDETRLAFADLEARAEASSIADRISVRNYSVEVEIGAFQAERNTTQTVRFNVVVEVRTNDTTLDDDVDRILSYDTITDAINQSLAEERLNLLETLADRIAEKILINMLAMRVFVRVEKLDRGPGALGVEIVREQKAEHSEQNSDQQAISPTVLFCDNEAIHSALLTGWIDQIASNGKPVVLCVGNGEMNAPVSDSASTQEKIDLLAIEQNAWVLAGKDPRCIVTGSRTELDWGVQNNQISIWAPTRMVLDATDATAPIKTDVMTLVIWFCKQMNAKTLVSLGSEHFADKQLQVINVPNGQATLF